MKIPLILIAFLATTLVGLKIAQNYRHIVYTQPTGAPILVDGSKTESQNDSNNSRLFRNFTTLKELANTELKKQKDMSYDVYTFSMEWPGTVCDNKTCKKSNDHLDGKTWNMHGLWPTSTHIGKRMGPFSCTNEHFTWNKLSKNLQTEVKTFWDGMFSSDATFLRHEYEKHGTCWDPTQGNLSEMSDEIRAVVSKARGKFPSSSWPSLINEYFTLGYLIHKEHNYYKVLANAGITPSASKSYEAADIEKAFTDEYDVEKMELHCLGNSEGKFVELNEVRLCLDMSYNPTDCPKRKFTTCYQKGWKVKILPHHPF